MTIKQYLNVVKFLLYWNGTYINGTEMKMISALYSFTGPKFQSLSRLLWMKA